MKSSRENKPWSSLATRFCVAVMTFAIGMGAHWVSSFRSPESTPPPPAPSFESAEPGTLRATILAAKAKGDKTVELSLIACGSDTGRLQDALSKDTVVLAELVGQKTYADTYGVHTWYRFKVKETLVQHPPPPLDYSPFESAPSDMLPIAEDELVIQEANGRMEIEGITVIQHSNGAAYLEGQTYLLFLWIDPLTRTATRIGTDPLGVFLVDNNGNLTSYIDQPYPLKTDLRRRFKDSVDNMREALKK